ncbi:MAG: hypothetical protein RIB93_05275 [Coleofasciculus sp. D1-CHI-01]
MLYNSRRDIHACEVWREKVETFRRNVYQLIVIVGTDFPAILSLIA